MTQFVKYIGPAHHRMITADEWRRAGVPDQETVVWSYHNAFSVAIDRLTDDALRVGIEPDEFFVVVGGDEHAPRDLVRRQTPAQAAGEGRIDMAANVEPSIRE